MSMAHESTDRATISSAPEDLFAELFTQVFGVEKTQFLTPQFAVTDIYHGSRFVDFALRTRDERIAFEIDGLICSSSAGARARRRVRNA